MGAGNVGLALARRRAARDHTITYGARPGRGEVASGDEVPQP